MRRLILAFALLLIAAAPAQSQVRVERLERLAAYLDTVAPAHYSPDFYGNDRQASDPNFCGCAAGHATAIFAREGFRLEITTTTSAYRGRRHPDQVTTRTTVRFGEHRGRRAIEEFFGLTPEAAEFAFFGHARDPRLAAMRLRHADEKRPPPREGSP